VDGLDPDAVSGPAAGEFVGRVGSGGAAGRHPGRRGQHRRDQPTDYPAAEPAAAGGLAALPAAGHGTGTAAAAARDTGRASARPPRPNPRYLALLRVDLAALRRGALASGELCEITGVGPVPVPVPVARDLLGESVLKLVITRGVDVAQVTHLGCGPTAAQRIALAWTSPPAAPSPAAPAPGSNTTTASPGPAPGAPA
jgi:hypothetical protein